MNHVNDAAGDDAVAPDNANADDIEHGVRLPNRAVSHSRRDSSALYPAQFMEREVYLAAAELCLQMCSDLGHIAALLVLHHRHILMLLGVSSTAACLLEKRGRRRRRRRRAPTI